MKGGYLGGWFAVCDLRTDRQMDGWMGSRPAMHSRSAFSLTILPF